MPPSLPEPHRPAAREPDEVLRRFRGTPPGILDPRRSEFATLPAPETKFKDCRAGYEVPHDLNRGLPRFRYGGQTRRHQVFHSSLATEIPLDLSPQKAFINGAPTSAVFRLEAFNLRSLPQTADQVIGERWTGQKKLIGYRLRNAPPNGSISGLKQLDIWIDAGTREADHVDITTQEPGKPVHQMHINNIQVGAEVNRSLFDLTPPAGYTPIAIPSGEPRSSEPAPLPNTQALRAAIGQSAALTAVVMPMQGPYTQTRSALQAVESYLKTHGVSPVGRPFGRYRSEQHWDAGYPVIPPPMPCGF